MAEQQKLIGPFCSILKQCISFWEWKINFPETSLTFALFIPVFLHVSETFNVKSWSERISIWWTDEGRLWFPSPPNLIFPFLSWWMSFQITTTCIFNIYLGLKRLRLSFENLKITFFNIFPSHHVNYDLLNQTYLFSQNVLRYLK